MAVEQCTPSPEVAETPKSEFVASLEKQWAKGNFVCVGLDTDYSQIPKKIQRIFSVGEWNDPLGNYGAIVHFNKAIIDATADLVCAYKPNAAFYLEQGSEGLEALRRTTEYIKAMHPDITVILDAKVGDIGNTNNGYAQFAFDKIGADAITVHNYLGKEAMKPFLDYKNKDHKDKGVIVLAKTSNTGAGEFQDGLVLDEYLEGMLADPTIEQVSTEQLRAHTMREYTKVARNVAQEWNENGNCAVVVGATYPRELAEVRAIVGDMPILIPGIGAQGGEVEATVTAGKDSRGWGMIVNSSRGIIFAYKDEQKKNPDFPDEDFAQAARAATQKLHDQINQYR